MKINMRTSTLNALLLSSLLLWAKESPALDCCGDPVGPVTAFVADSLNSGPAYGVVTIDGVDYNGWCLRPERFIFPANQGFSHPNSVLYSTCEDQIDDTLAAISEEDDLVFNGVSGNDPEKFLAINWIINNRAGYTAKEVQSAIWIVLYNYWHQALVSPAEFATSLILANAAMAFAEQAGPNIQFPTSTWAMKAPPQMLAGELYRQQLMLLETVCPPSNPGTGTPGYWKNHPEAWPVLQITLGTPGCEQTFTKSAAISKFNDGGGSDKRWTLFRALVCAKLNVLIGNDSSCIAATIAAADAWWCQYGIGTTRRPAKSQAWREGEPLYLLLDGYNNGLLCAPHRD